MTEESKNREKEKSRKGNIKSFLGGSLLASDKVMKQMPFVFFLVFIGIMMISNRYWAEKTITGIEAMQDSIKELKAESITFETELLKINKPSEIQKRITENGSELIESKVPPRKIKVETLNEE